MTTQLGRATLSDDGGSYGIPTLIIDGRSYGPEDVYDGEMMGLLICTRGCATRDQAALISRWAAQSATYGQQWIAMVEASVTPADPDNLVQPQ